MLPGMSCDNRSDIAAACAEFFAQCSKRLAIDATLSNLSHFISGKGRIAASSLSKWIGDLSPVLFGDDKTNLHWSDAKLLGQLFHCWSEPPPPIQFTDSFHLLFCKGRVPVLFSRRERRRFESTSIHHIFSVFFSSSRPKMIWSNTRSYVAFMEYIQAFWHWTVYHLPCKTVWTLASSGWSSRTHHGQDKFSIAGRFVYSPCPNPTTFGLPSVFPKSFKQTRHGSHTYEWAIGHA